MDASTCDEDSRRFVGLIAERAGHDRLQAKLYLVHIGQCLKVLRKKFVWHPQGAYLGYSYGTSLGTYFGDIRVAPVWPPVLGTHHDVSTWLAWFTQSGFGDDET